jgi:hypothetical protein
MSTKKTHVPAPAPAPRHVRDDAIYSALRSRLAELKQDLAAKTAEIIALESAGVVPAVPGQIGDRQAAARRLLNNEPAPTTAEPSEGDRLAQLRAERDVIEQAITLGEQHQHKIYNDAERRVFETLEPEFRAVLKAKVRAVIDLDRATRQLEELRVGAGLSPGIVPGQHRLLPPISMHAGAAYDFIQWARRAGYVDAELEKEISNG